MAELKTRPNGKRLSEYLDEITDTQRRRDCEAVMEMMEEITGEKPRMWGTSMVGFGSYHYKYASGREGDWMLTGFSSRKRELTVYIMTGFEEQGELMEKLGKYKTGKSCLYIKKLEDIDVNVLETLVRRSVEKLSQGNH